MDNVFIFIDFSGIVFKMFNFILERFKFRKFIVCKFKVSSIECNGKYCI